MLVKLTKLRANPETIVLPGNWNDYRCGQLTNNTSLPVDYLLVGELIEPPVVGSEVVILRFIRNGIEDLGIFRSTAVVALTADGFATLNSVYRLESL